MNIMTHRALRRIRSSRLTTTALLLIAGGLLAQPALARVELVNEVHKVQRFVDETGQVQRRLIAPDSVIPGDELRYSVRFTNIGNEVVDERSVVITNPIPVNTEYLEGSALGDTTEIQFSVDKGTAFATPAGLMIARNSSEAPANARDYTTIRWIYEPGLAPGETGMVSFNVRLK